MAVTAFGTVMNLGVTCIEVACTPPSPGDDGPTAQRIRERFARREPVIAVLTGALDLGGGFGLMFNVGSIRNVNPVVPFLGGLADAAAGAAAFRLSLQRLLAVDAEDRALRRESRQVIADFDDREDSPNEAAREVVVHTYLRIPDRDRPERNDNGSGVNATVALAETMNESGSTEGNAAIELQ